GRLLGLSAPMKNQMKAIDLHARELGDEIPLLCTPLIGRTCERVLAEALWHVADVRNVCDEVCRPGGLIGLLGLLGRGERFNLRCVDRVKYRISLFALAGPFSRPLRLLLGLWPLSRAGIVREQPLFLVHPEHARRAIRWMPC